MLFPLNVLFHKTAHQIWDSSFLSTTTGSHTGDVVEVCVFKGHKGPVSALDWAEQPDGGQSVLAALTRALRAALDHRYITRSCLMRATCGFWGLLLLTNLVSSIAITLDPEP